MEKVILPHTNPPIIQTYPDFTDLLFAFQGNQEVYSWLLSRMVNIYAAWYPEQYGMICNFYDKSQPWYTTPMHACPMLQVQSVDPNMVIKAWPSPVEYVKEMIRSGYYTVCLVDRAKFACMSSERENLHDMLAYGYDDKHIFIAGFKRGETYNVYKVQYSDFDDSLDYFRKLPIASYQSAEFKQKNSTNRNQFFGFKYIGIETFLGPNMHFRQFYEKELSLACFLDEFRHYFNETRLPAIENMKYGSEIYEVYERYCHFLSENRGKENIHVFRQSVHLIYSHKIIVKSICTYLKSKGVSIVDDIFALCDKLIDRGLIVRNALLRLDIIGDYEFANKQIPAIRNMKEIEKEIFRHVENSLERYLSGVI